MEPSLCVVSSRVIRVYIILVWSTINGSSNLNIYFYHCLILTLILHLKKKIIITITTTIITTIATTIISIIIVIIIISTSININIIVIVVVVVVVIYNLYSWPLYDSTLILPGYLLLRHSCTWEKISIFWLCHLWWCHSEIAHKLRSC